MEPQEKRRLLVFAVLVVLFDAVMAVWYGLTGQSNVLVACMFTPMLSVILTRLVTGEGARDLYLAPRFRGQVRWYLAVWFATPLLVYAGALLYFVVFPQDFDPMGSVLAAQLEAAAPAEYAAALAQLIPLAVLVNPLTGLAQAFGEEFAWRGYLLPKLAKVLSPVRAVLATGVIWGLWHAPFVAMGYNYGAGHPAANIAAMVVFCVFVGSIEGFLFLRTGSVWPAALFHAALNGIDLWAPADLLMSRPANAFLGPNPVGILGGAGLIMAGCLCLWRLARLPQTAAAAKPQN